MKTTAASVENRTSVPPVEPFRVKQCLVGLDFDGSLEALLGYLNFFSGQIPVESADFLHVLPSPSLFDVSEENNEDFLQEAALGLEVEEKLRLQVHQTFGDADLPKIHVEVKVGGPLEQLLKTARSQKSDLVVIAHNGDKAHHSILTKNFIRQVGGNVLVVPDKAKKSLKKILIPVDFSPNSAQALRTGVAINKQLKKPAKIAVLHTYQLPANFSAHRFNESRVLEMLESDRKQALSNFIEEHIPAEDRTRIEPILLKDNRFSIGQYIASFAENHKFNLVIIGAKGHSKVALLLLGSVTEKLISTTKKVPVLVVK